MTDEQRLQVITDQLILVRDNLFRGMSKSIQKLQARSINEVLGKDLYTTPPEAQPAPVQESARKRVESVMELADAYANAMERGPFSRSYRGNIQDTRAALQISIEKITTPPAAQRPFVGLTDEERTEIRREHYARTLPLMDAVEAKLKEKNT
jgi:hypothetical protein